MSASLLFTSPRSCVTPAFWAELFALKLRKWKHETREVQLWPRFASASDPDTVMFDSDCFDGDGKEEQQLECKLVLFDTIEQFKKADKNAMLQQFGQAAWAGSEEKCPILFTCFADLKAMTAVYWIAFPAFASTTPLQAHVQEAATALSEPNALVVTDLLSPLAEVAPLAVPGAVLLGWRVRNLLARLVCAQGGEPEEVSLRLLVLRPPRFPPAPTPEQQQQQQHMSSPSPFSQTSTSTNSLLLTLRVRNDGGASAYGRAPGLPPPRVVGWELDASGKPAARRVDLASALDPAVVAAQAVQLNTQLLQWRAWPDLDLARVQGCRCLVLGAGTLGCGVARGLVGWGVRSITFVDSGRVSFSNPSRQTLFELADAQAGAFKAEAAVAALRRITPASLLDARSVVLSIPMPGHPNASDAAIAADASTLRALIDEHDAVFSLLDSREARWLPTLLCGLADKLLVTAALGTDSYLVMRSGIGLGCYYCQDVVGVGDSTKDRALDQQCTVSRPGGSAVAAALAVELLVSRLQYGDDTTKAPHAIRGSVGSFQQAIHKTLPFDRCVCCSAAVRNGMGSADFFPRVVHDVDGAYLQRVSGIDELLSQGGLDMSSLFLDDEEEEEKEEAGAI